MKPNQLKLKYTPGHILDGLQEQHEVVILILGQRETELLHRNVQADLRDSVTVLFRIRAPLQPSIGRDRPEEIHQLRRRFFHRSDVRVKHEIDDVIIASRFGFGRKEVRFGSPVNGKTVQDDVLLENLYRGQCKTT